MRYFLGSGENLGVVTCSDASTFRQLFDRVLSKPVRIRQAETEFLNLPKKDKEAALDQQRAKRVRYITPGAFRDSPCQRTHENVLRCNLVALDIDDSSEAARLLAINWTEVFKELAFVVWKTISSTDQAPRLRVIVSAEGIAPSAYPNAARTVAEMIGMKHIDSRVTFHAVQPMFLPTVFADSEDSPIVASNPDGDAFLPMDIIEDADSIYVDQTPKASTEQIAELEYLRAPIEGVSLADAQSALDVLDPDLPMQPWIEIAAGLKHQFDSGDAYRLWDTWSARGKKYVDSAETKYRWESLKAQPTDRAPVTIRSLFKQAQARGWENPALARVQHSNALSWIKSPSRSAEELLDQGAKRIAKVSPMLGVLERKTLLVALRDTLAARDVALPLPDIKKAVHALEVESARTTGVPPWAKGLCFITSENTFFRPSTERRFMPEVLDLMYGSPAIGEEKPVRPRDYVIQIAGCQQVEAPRYNPALAGKRYFSEDSVPYVNTYRPNFAPPEPARADDAGEVYLMHRDKLIAEPEHRRTLTDWLAHLVQYPGKKIRWTPLIQSCEGAGKTFLHDMMVVCLGRRNAFKVSGNFIMQGAYNDWAEGHQLVTIEEIRVVGSNRHAVMDKLKEPITDNDVPINRKYCDHKTVPNVTNYLMFTNYHDSLAVNDDGRRYFVLSSPIQDKEHIAAMGGPAHFRQVAAMVRDNPGGLRSFFEQWPINPAFDADGRAPVTKYLHELAQATASPLTAAVKDCIEDEPHALVRRDLISLGCLRGALDSGHLPDFSDQALASVLKELGWMKYGRVMVDGLKHQLWMRKKLADPRRIAEMRLQSI